MNLDGYPSAKNSKQNWFHKTKDRGCSRLSRSALKLTTKEPGHMWSENGVTADKHQVRQSVNVQLTRLKDTCPTNPPVKSAFWSSLSTLRQKGESVTALETGSLTRLTLQILFHIPGYPSTPEMDERSHTWAWLVRTIPNTHPEALREKHMMWGIIGWVNWLSHPHGNYQLAPCKASYKIHTKSRSGRTVHIFGSP